MEASIRRLPQLVIENRIQSVVEEELARGLRLEELVLLHARDGAENVTTVEWPPADEERMDLIGFQRLTPTLPTVLTETAQEQWPPLRHPRPERPTPPEPPDRPRRQPPVRDHQLWEPAPLRPFENGDVPRGSRNGHGVPIHDQGRPRDGDTAAGPADTSAMAATATVAQPRAPETAPADDGPEPLHGVPFAGLPPQTMARDQNWGSDA